MDPDAEYMHLIATMVAIDGRNSLSLAPATRRNWVRSMIDNMTVHKSTSTIQSLFPQSPPCSLVLEYVPFGRRRYLIDCIASSATRSFLLHQGSLVRCHVRTPQSPSGGLFFHGRQIAVAWIELAIHGFTIFLPLYRFSKLRPWP